jgi:hypothetical protein
MSRMSPASQTETPGAEVLDENTILRAGASEKIGILAAGRVRANPGDIVTIVAPCFHDVERKVLVCEQLHAKPSCNAITIDLFLAQNLAGVRHTREQILAL